MQTSLRFEQFEVRPAERLLLIDGRPAVLGARAFDLLLCLLAHRDRVVSKSEALEIVWPGLVVEENNLSVQVSTLRKLLGTNTIATVSSVGYRFVARAAASDASAHSADFPSPALIMERPAIAVLPFIVRCDNAHIRFLADGLAEDVIALLARVPGFLLISHASSFAFRGHSAGLQDVARQLGVRFIVEGSVRPKGAVLQVSTQLTDAESGRVLWAGRFESRREEAVDLQEDIARGIISQLEPELTRAEIAHIRRQRPESQGAWSHYRLGVGAVALQGWGAEAMAEALAQIQQSVTIDAAFSLGHAQFALLTALALKIGVLPNNERRVEDALRAADRAIELDDGSAEVLGYAGCAMCELGRHQRGLAMLQRALEIDPSNAQAHVALGATLGMTGQYVLGIDRMRFGMKISPRDRRLGFWRWALGNFLLKVDRADEALAEADASSRSDTKFHLARVLQAVVLDRLGRTSDAAASLSAARRLRPELTLGEVTLTHGRRAGERMAILWAEAAPTTNVI